VAETSVVICTFKYLITRQKIGARVAPKLMPPISLCWPTTSEADGGDMPVEVEPPSYDALVRAVKEWATSAGADFYECGMPALVHHWRKCTANGGVYVEK